MGRKHYYQEIYSTSGVSRPRAMAENAIILALVIMVAVAFTSLVGMRLQTHYTRIQDVLLELAP